MKKLMNERTSEQGKQSEFWNWHKLLRRLGVGTLAIAAVAYGGTGWYLHANQRRLLYEPRRDLLRLPSGEELQMPYEEVLLPIRDWSRLHGWWIPAVTKPLVARELPLPGEPFQVVKGRKVAIIFTGRSGNKSSNNYMRRAEALRQLGFSVLMVDYRGFGPSSPGWPEDWPSEQTLYEDAEVAWRFVQDTYGYEPKDIWIYGESMGGAVAIDLASKHPDAGGLIAQSTFTSMADAVRQDDWMRLLPVDWILQEEFRSLEKVKGLKVPVLFIHGTGDKVVDYRMSERLYAAAPGPKMLHLIPDAGHSQIYVEGKNSYVGAIARFVARWGDR